MKSKILDYFHSINCINVSSHGGNCCKTSIAVSKCVYLANMAVKIERTVVAIIMVFCNNAYLMFMPAELWGPNQS